MPKDRLRAWITKQKVIKKPSNFYLKIVAAENEWRGEHSESEFYYSDEYEFLDTLKYSTPLNADVLISISRGFFQEIGTVLGKGHN